MRNRRKIRWKASEIAARIAYFIVVRIMRLSGNGVSRVMSVLLWAGKRQGVNELILGDIEYLRDIFKNDHIHSETMRRMMLEARKSQFISTFRGFLYYR